MSKGEVLVQKLKAWPWDCFKIRRKLAPIVLKLFFSFSFFLKIFFNVEGKENSCFALTDFSQGLLYNSWEFLLETFRWNFAAVQERVIWSCAEFWCVRRQKFFFYSSASNQKSFDLSREIRPHSFRKLNQSVLRRMAKFIIHCSKSL